LLSIAAHTGPGMAVYLRSYYTEYEVTLDCTEREHLSAADAAMAKDAMAKIEAYYLKRDSSINKDKVLKQAVANKNQAFKMMQETTKVDARQFCQASLNDLISKVREIDADAIPVKKSGS
jgi:Tfp pilus assembly protein PilE